MEIRDLPGMLAAQAGTWPPGIDVAEHRIRRRQGRRRERKFPVPAEIRKSDKIDMDAHVRATPDQHAHLLNCGGSRSVSQVWELDCLPAAAAPRGVDPPGSDVAEPADERREPRLFGRPCDARLDPRAQAYLLAGKRHPHRNTDRSFWAGWTDQ